MKNKNIVLDTNLWISFLISKRLFELDILIKNKNITLIFSTELLEEFIEVVTRPKFEKYFTKSDIEKILNYFNQYGKLINVQSNMKVCRDEKDNFLLNLSINSAADFLITGDNDLLILKQIEKTKIITFSGFLELYK